MCQGRAVADGRLAVGRFSDPVAAQLLTAEEHSAVELARSSSAPADGRRRLSVESLRACAEGVVPRTVAIDDAVREAAHGQVVLVGAGLDSRPWRMPELGAAVVFSVDHPDSQADARQRSTALSPTARGLEYVPADLTRRPLDEALAAASTHDPAAATTWVWEGVVPYLTPEQVEATVAALARRSAPGSVLVVQYQSPSRVAALGRRVMGLVARLSGADDPMAEEPWRSAWRPQAMAALLARHGFVVRRDEDLLGIATALGSPSTRRRSLSTGRVAVAALALTG